MKTLEEIAERIEKFYFDIKTEVMAADLFAEGLPQDSFSTLHLGSHKRPFSRDLEQSSLEYYKGSQRHIVLKLNRDSIYDSLPQGVFHSPRPRKHGVSIENMVEDYRQRKKEEKEARNFFTPFEHEFFIQKTFVELAERELLFDMGKGNLGDFFLTYLDIDPTLPTPLLSKLVCLLPYLDKITGNFPLTAKCLELTINEKVKFKRKFQDELVTLESFTKLGDTCLGLDLTLGNSLEPDFEDLEFIIGPVSKEGLHKFLENGTHLRFIKQLYEFLIPASIDVTTTIEVEADSQYFELDNNSASSRLGFTTTI